MSNQSISSFKLIWLLSYISIASVSATIITPALPLIQRYYALNPGAVEWLVSAFLIGYTIGQLLYAPLANRYGSLKALRFGLIINLFGTLVCLVALSINNYWLLVIGRLITALGAASGLACTFMLINAWLPEQQRKTAMAYSVLSFALGLGIAVVLGGMITDFWQWQGCFWFLLIHAIAVLCGTYVFKEAPFVSKPIHVLTIIKDYTAALSSPKLVVFSLVVGSSTAISYCFSAAGPQIAKDLLALSPAEYGYWNGINIIGMLAGGLIVKQLLARFSAIQVIAVGFLGIALGIMNLFFMWTMNSHSALWFFLIAASFYLFNGLLFSSGSFIASNALTDKASAAGMMSFINMSFATLWVIVMGYLGVNPLLSFAETLSLVWILVIVLVLIEKQSAKMESYISEGS
ncbi:MFS transporter [Legionella lytica]|uniref:MFS transporter n=1 Tax=Legionella lytica TaxID=96232 RepID=A0ABY4YBW9_9GAMM|nr:MFS transporter [Legionella lytica]USQ14942.1 MFS transporter [Legionella lytica]